ncbi:hypothetical protein F8568_032920 [Actinomadura sp. LD22]|uniref:Uncharacterized protein n=1 Tax=Actinomadura physcomitrii TaxID=2650748 RepID=A0A6I4MLS5_9ACTN|nr:hypothetical protein [Actinomadura physcomitrii]MWA05084.1 hypothetical protein [Actinomadura physcomitrii]
MASKPLEQVTLADLVTKDDLKDLVTKDHLDRELGLVRQEFRQELRQELGSAVNLIMGELGKMAARQEEMAGVLARLVARSEGVTR